MKQLNRAGYTLVEVITTAAIIASLASIAGSNVFVRSKVNMIVNMELVKQELKEIGRNMVELYSTDNSFPADIFNIGNTPPETAITASLNHIENKLCYGDQSYINGYSLTVCPDDTVKCGDRCFRLTDSGTIEEIPVGAVVDPPEDVLPPEVDPVIPVDPPDEPVALEEPALPEMYTVDSVGDGYVGDLIMELLGPPNWGEMTWDEQQIFEGAMYDYAIALSVQQAQALANGEISAGSMPGLSISVDATYEQYFRDNFSSIQSGLSMLGINAYLGPQETLSAGFRAGYEMTYSGFRVGLESTWGAPSTLSQMISWIDTAYETSAFEAWTLTVPDFEQNNQYGEITEGYGGNPAIYTAVAMGWFNDQPNSGCTSDCDPETDENI